MGNLRIRINRYNGGMKKKKKVREWRRSWRKSFFSVIEMIKLCNLRGNKRRNPN